MTTEDSEIEDAIQGAEETTTSSPQSSIGKSAGSCLGRLAQWLIGFIAVMLLLMFVFSLLARHVYLAELLGHFRLHLFLALALFAYLTSFCKKYALTVLLILAASWASIGVVTVFFPQSQPPPGKQTLKIMSFNLLGTSREFASAIDVIDDHDPDVLTLVEYANEWTDVFAEYKLKYPHRIELPRWHGYGIAVFSKLPIENSRVVQLLSERMDNPMIEAELDLGGRPIRLLAVHLLSPVNAERADMRNVQLREIEEVANSKPAIPTVLMGDFNCTPWTPTLFDLLQQTGLRDSRQGFGYHATWSNEFPIIKLPIDHAFVSSEIHVHDRQVGGVSGSDHYPIIFEVSVSEPGTPPSQD